MRGYTSAILCILTLLHRGKKLTRTLTPVQTNPLNVIVNTLRGGEEKKNQPPVSEGFTGDGFIKAKISQLRISYIFIY